MGIFFHIILLKCCCFLEKSVNIIVCLIVDNYLMMDYNIFVYS